MSRKFICLFVALTLIGFGLALPFAYSDVQIDRGQQRSTAAKKFVVVRNARSFPVGAVGWMNNGNVLSKDSVVVWDTVSDDGVSVAFTGTSGDARVAGILLDNITGSSRDYSAASDDGYGNWGRMQCWGLYSAALFASHMHRSGGSWVSGSKVGTSAYPGRLGMYTTASNDRAADVSADYLGIALDGTTAGDTTMDVFIDRC